WVCISMRNRNSRALARIIDQYRAASDEAVGSPPPFFGANDPAEPVPAVRARITTEALWKQIADFETQRLEREPDQDEGENRTARWRRRLKNISEIEIVQATDAFLDLDLTFRGTRIDNLEAALAVDAEASSPPLTSDLMPDSGLPM